MTIRKPKTPEEALLQYMTSLRKACEEDCDVKDASIDASNLKQKGKYDKIVDNKKDNSKQKKDMNFDNLNPNILNRDIPHDGTGKKNANTGEKYDPRTEDSWSDKEKAKFDAKWKKQEDQKSDDKKIGQELVDDPEVAAIGGFDRGSRSVDGTQSQEGGPDNNNEDGENIDEPDPDAVEPVEDGPSLEELNNALDKTREDLVVKKRRSESSKDKIYSILGIKGDTDNITEEIQGFQDAYDSAIESVRNQLLQEQDGATDTRKKEINAQLRFMAKDEGVKMNEAETKARLETKFSRLGDKIDKVGKWYKNLDPKVKYAMAGGLFALGVATGGVGVAGGAITAAAGMKRLFGAVAMGVGVGMAVETKMSTKKSEKETELREQFKGLTLEQQADAIQDMNLETQAEFDKIKTDRRRVKFTKIATVAVFLVGGQMLSSAFAGHEQTGDVQTEADTSVKGDISTGDTHLESSLDAADSTAQSAMGATEGVNAGDISEHDKVNEYLTKKAGEDSAGGVDTEVYKSFEDAVDNVEQQKAELAAWQVAHGGAIDIDTQTAMDRAKNVAMEQSDASSAADNPTDQGITDAQRMDVSDAVDNPTQEGILYEDNDAIENRAGEQSDASGVEDNPLSQGFNHIEMNADNMGTLIVEDGSSIEGTLIKFLETNSEKLTEGGMGWDPEDARWGGDVEKWAGARAHGLVQEFANAHPGIDLDTVQPNTALNLDLSNPADVRVDIDFEGGPRIIPEGGKVEIATSGENVEIPVQNTETPLSQTEIDTAQSVEPSTVVEGGATKSTWVNPDTGKEFTPAGEATPEKAPSFPEVDAIAKLIKNPEFQTALSTQIKDIAGVEDIGNIANTQISLFESNDGGAINSKINGVIHRAQQAFGDSVGVPQNNATVGSYVTRIFARAAQEGKVKDIFPSSDFSL